MHSLALKNLDLIRGRCPVEYREKTGWVDNVPLPPLSSENESK